MQLQCLRFSSFLWSLENLESLKNFSKQDFKPNVLSFLLHKMLLYLNYFLCNLFLYNDWLNYSLYAQDLHWQTRLWHKTHTVNSMSSKSPCIVYVFLSVYQVASFPWELRMVSPFPITPLSLHCCLFILSWHTVEQSWRNFARSCCLL